MLILFLKSLVFTVLVPGTVGVLIPLQIAERTATENTWFVLLGSISLAFGLVVYCKCVWDFVILGKGTPAPIDAPKHLVVRGLYHYSRNPMYLGVLIVIIGWVQLYASLNILIYGISVATCFQMFVIFYEEPKLQQIFGIEYASYRGGVNRWVPGIFTPKNKIKMY